MFFYTEVFGKPMKMRRLLALLALCLVTASAIQITPGMAASYVQLTTGQGDDDDSDLTRRPLDTEPVMHNPWPALALIMMPLLYLVVLL